MYSPVQAVPKDKTGNLQWHKGDGLAHLILSTYLRRPNRSLVTLGSFYSEWRVGEAPSGDSSSLLSSELPSSCASCSSFLKKKIKALIQESLTFFSKPSPSSPQRPKAPLCFKNLRATIKCWDAVSCLGLRLRKLLSWGRHLSWLGELQLCSEKSPELAPVIQTSYAS